MGAAGGAGSVGWVPGKGRTLEELREHALMCLAPIERARRSRDLLEQGLSPQEVAERTGIELRLVLGVQQHMERGEEIRPVTPKELGWRRAVGQISSQEMMERLRAWPYTLSRLHGYDGYESGTEDDLESLLFHGFLSDEEYHELRVIVDAIPRPPEPEYGTEEYWRG